MSFFVKTYHVYIMSNASSGNRAVLQASTGIPHKLLR